MPSDTISALLELLVERAGCTYLSDLHAGQYAASVCGAAEGIGDGQFSADSWNGAIRYIAGRDAAFCTAPEAKAFLTAFLMRPADMP